MPEANGQWLTLKEAAERLGMTKEGVRKRIKEKQIDAYQDGRGRWMVQLSEPQEAQELEVVAQLPAIPTPDNHELLQRLAAIGEVLERQQEHNERLVARIGELERENGRLQAQLEARESTESDEAAQDAPQHVYTLPEPAKRPWWQRWLQKGKHDGY